MYFEGMLEQQWAVAWPCGRRRQSDGALWTYMASAFSEMHMSHL